MEKLGFQDKKEDVTGKIEAAERAFREYRKTSFSERKEKMLAVAENLKKERNALAEVITKEMGKPIKESRAEIDKCAWVCEYYAERSEEFLQDEIITSDADKSYVSYEPLGVILAIMPWNFPFWQVFRFAAPTIMAGNTTVLKHASLNQRSAFLMEEIFLKSGFAKAIFQNLSISSSDMEDIIRNPLIKAVSLTGSGKAGASVAGISGSEVKTTVLELGGSNSFIVFPDADIKKAARLGVKARMLNNGQSCIASKRFILHKDIANSFIEAFSEGLDKLKIGDPLKEDTDVGPMSSEDQAKTLEDQVKRSIEAGAKLFKGGKRNKAYFDPTILTNVKPGMPAFDEELFGPVASMIVADSMEEAVRLSNSSEFGLGVSMITKNIKAALELSRDIEDGAVFINELVKSDPRLPFGGTKKSGYGRELSGHGIREFINVKTVYVS